MFTSANGVDTNGQAGMDTPSVAPNARHPIGTNRGSANQQGSGEMVTRMREAGYIFTATMAKREFECNACADPILPGDDYYKVEKGGGGVAWAVNPDRIHATEIDKRRYLEMVSLD